MASIPQFSHLPQMLRTCDFKSDRVSLFCRPVCRRYSSGLYIDCIASDHGFGSQNAQKSGFSKLQIPYQKFQISLRPSQNCVAVPQASASGEHNTSENFNAHSVMSKPFSLSQMVSLSVQNFPWDKAYTGLSRRISDLLLTLWTWIALPILVFIAINEIIYTVSVGKELFIPIGLLAGSLLAGILAETAITLGNESQERLIQWLLLGIAAFFAFMKIAGMKCLKSSFWASVFLVHFANGGLWQAIRFLVRWTRNKVEMADSRKFSSVGQRQA